MFYEFDITVSKNTAEADAQKTVLRLQRGIITEASVQIPTGCKGLVNLRAKRGGQALWPKNIEGSIKGNGAIIPISAYEELKAGWNQIDIYTWNTSTKHDHTLTLRIIVLPDYVANPFAGMESIRNSLILLLRRIGVLE